MTAPRLPADGETMDEAIFNINHALANDVPVHLSRVALKARGFIPCIVHLCTDPGNPVTYTNRYGGLYQWDPKTDRLTFIGPTEFEKELATRPILHLTLTGYHAGVPICGADRHAEQARGAMFAHATTAPPCAFTQPKLCPQCKAAWDAAADDEE
jgi:hypothetical protein